MKKTDLLIRILKEMNEKFGQGEISEISINMEETDQTTICGVAICGDGPRLFKVSENCVIFLSRKRKFPKT